MSVEDFIRAKGNTGFSGRLAIILIFIVADLLVVMGSFGLGFLIVKLNYFTGINSKSFITYWPYLPAFLVVFSMVHLYPGVNLNHAEELKRFFIASLLGHAGIVLSRFIQSNHFDLYSLAFGLSWVVSVPGFSAGRGIARRMFSSASFWGIPVVIFGAGKTGRLVTERLIKNRWLGLKPVVILDDESSLAGEYMGVPILTGTVHGPRLARECGFDTAIVAMPGVNRESLAVIMADYVRSFRRFTLIPDFFGMTNIWMTVRDLNGILGLYTDQRLLSAANRRIKRILDLFISVFGGLVISPLLLIIALLIAIDSPGPILYGQKRLGKDGKAFTAWKFRSMRRDATRALAELLARDQNARKEWESNFKLRSDPRVTRMGRFLRKTSLDEFPQLINVVRGEMSLIGPRPIVDAEVEKYGHDYRLFSSVKPGMSGLWQVSGRSETDYAERVSLDIYYIQSWSLWLDMYILFRTVAVIFGGRGAY